jgi:putative FmdB family regulatory protein
MPIYEYRVIDGKRGCNRCQMGIEVIQPIHDDPMEVCPQCHAPVVRVHSVANFRTGGQRRSPVEEKIRDYERKGMYSHAAELADKEAEKTNREDLKSRAMDDYKKAGYKDL